MSRTKRRTSAPPPSLRRWWSRGDDRDHDSVIPSWMKRDRSRLRRRIARQRVHVGDYVTTAHREPNEDFWNYW